jgi:translation initiation factor 2B subunit (eIF-2B alpha/beta/delta family)
MLVVAERVGTFIFQITPPDLVVLVVAERVGMMPPEQLERQI